MTTGELTNASVVGRLLEEISWEGSRVRAYRNGGRGRENVLTAEVLSPLGYLPRDLFLGEIVRAAQGAESARLAVASGLEVAEVMLLPDETVLPGSSIVVQPDALFSSPRHLVLVEAKRIRSSSFQPEQLAREYLALLEMADGRLPLLLLILGSPPPVAVKGLGRLDPAEAIRSTLADVAARMEGFSYDLDQLNDAVSDTLAWITWAQISDIVARQADAIIPRGDGTDGTVKRLAAAITNAIDWHS